jgi:hypothetical protein
MNRALCKEWKDVFIVTALMRGLCEQQCPLAAIITLRLSGLVILIVAFNE